MKKEIVLSVHGLVDFLLRKGDIDNRIYNSSSMLEGTRIHLRYQQIQNGDYISEQYLETLIDFDEYQFRISGRADGIIVSGTIPFIDEIKSTVIDLNEFYNSQSEWHLGQAKLYAYMYAKSNNLSQCGVRLTYISQIDNNDKLIFNFTFTFSELESYVYKLCQEYLLFYQEIEKHNQLKIESSERLIFPFDTYRNGQRELAKYVYGTIINNATFFIEAPTGIGKTISTLFPAVKTFSTANTEKIFYLCAKNVAKNVAYEGGKKLLENGLIARIIKLQSKERLCRMDSRNCNPDECIYAKGYYDKIKNIISQVLKKENTIDDKLINDIADNELICPFELQLDLSLYCDIIICDYNYLFDPNVYLKRFFEDNSTNYVALIDECHNLVERSRDMYSAILDSDILLDLKFEFKKFKALKFKRVLNKVLSYMEEQKAQQLEYVEVGNNFEQKFYQLLENLFIQMQDILKNNQDFVTNNFLDVFRQVNRFLKISQFISSNFHLYFKCEENVIATIKCLDSSSLLKDTLDKLKASIFFSATLSPIDYYINCLGGDKDTNKLILNSPFDTKNLLTIVRNDISTKLKNRSSSYQSIAETIETVTSGKIGNYLVFFPSYKYIEDVYDNLNLNRDVIYIKQERDMLEEDRHIFLDKFKFNPEKTTIGLAVLGGAFSEGIDLVSSRLIGAVIVGVGLPTISYERDKIKEYFDHKELDGFDYAYVFPGMNKVMQAAGRVIRGEKDVGIVIFIDDRFRYFKYTNLLKEQYQKAYYLSDLDTISKFINEFWKNHIN